MNSGHWTMVRLRLQQAQPAPIRFLLWVGLLKFYDSLAERPRIVGPFSAPSWQIFLYHLRSPGERVYIFRNLPGVINRVPGRLLPRRWGFGICGFEFGDRGAG